MRLGVGIICWHNEEMLESVVRNVAPSVEKIVLSWRPVSNFGQYATDADLDMYRNIEKQYGAKLLICNPPQNMHIYDQFILQRQMALDYCRDNGCSHFLFLETDEFYEPEQLELVKRYMEEKNLDSVTAPIWCYYKYPTNRVLPEESYYCPLISKIYPESHYHLNAYWPCYVDFGRIILPMGTHELLTGDKIILHHMSWVRKNISEKLYNCSTTLDPTAAATWPEVISRYESWKWGDKVKIFNRDAYRDSIKVHDIFGLESIYNDKN